MFSTGSIDLNSITIRKVDTLVIWRLDRLARSLKDLIEWVAYLEKKGIALKSIKENIDTSTPTGRLVFHIFRALSEFERSLSVERTHAVTYNVKHTVGAYLSTF
jgi:DNA invertase Pin-like site-specific DNA recombinase